MSLCFFSAKNMLTKTKKSLALKLELLFELERKFEGI